MASCPQPNTSTWLNTAAAIVAYTAVKLADDAGLTVAKSTAATDKSIGIAQNAGAAAGGDPIEVAMPGGGSKALLGGTVAYGDYLAPDSAGKLVATTTANDNVIAQALQAGVAEDIISVQVLNFNY